MFKTRWIEEKCDCTLQGIGELSSSLAMTETGNYGYCATAVGDDGRTHPIILLVYFL